MPAQFVNLPASRNIPDARGSIRAATKRQAAIGTPSHRVDERRVSLQLSDLITCDYIP